MRSADAQHQPESLQVTPPDQTGSGPHPSGEVASSDRPLPGPRAASSAAAYGSVTVLATTLRGREVVERPWTSPHRAPSGHGDRLDLVPGPAGAGAPARRWRSSTPGAGPARRTTWSGAPRALGDRQHDRGRQEPSGRCRAAASSAVPRLVGAVAVGLVDDVQGRRSRGYPALAAWMPSPMPGAKGPSWCRRARRSRPRSDRHPTVSTRITSQPGGVEDPQRLRRGPRQPAEVAAQRPWSGCRPHGRARGPASAPGPRAGLRRRTARTGRPPARHPLVVTAQLGDQCAGRGRLADPRGAGDADDLGVAGVRRQRRHHLAQQRGLVLDERDQPGDGPGKLGAGALDEVGTGASGLRDTRTIRASPPPPPPPEGGRADATAAALGSSQCSTIRAPDMPTGWPRAIAPAVDVHLGVVRPSSRATGDPDGGEASLNSTRSRSVRAMPSFRTPWRSRRRAAAAGSSRGRRPGRARRSRRATSGQLLGLRLAHHDHRGSPVGDLRGRSRR